MGGDLGEVGGTQEGPTLQGVTSSMGWPCSHARCTCSPRSHALVPQEVAVKKVI